jgi:hypothetical protein
MSDVSNRLPIGRPSLPVAAVLLLAACSSAAAPSQAPGSPPAGSGSPSSPGPSQAPPLTPGTTIGAIDHPVGASDVVLRLEEGGGFVPMEMMAAQAPTFTLYGVGVIVFQPRVETFPVPDANGVIHSLPWRTAKLEESQIQDLLEFAIGTGGLGTAKDSYVEGGIADAPNTIFTLKAGGLDKTVVVNALADGSTHGADAAARSAFFKLAQKLRDFDQGGSIPTDVYQPEGFRAVLMDREGQASGAISWPWPAIKPTDFVGDANGSGGTSLPHRTLSQADLDALGVKDAAGGLQGIVLEAPDGKTWTLIVRPLLPDEQG